MIFRKNIGLYCFVIWSVTYVWQEKNEPVEKPVEKPTPAYLREGYQYKSIGDAITDLDSLEDGVLYEIKCHQCEMSLRSQG